MFGATVLTGVDLKLIHQILGLVPEEAKVLVVTTTLPQRLDESVVGQSIYDGVLHRLDFEGRSSVGDEFHAEEEGGLSIPYCYLVDH